MLSDNLNNWFDSRAFDEAWLLVASILFGDILWGLGSLYCFVQRNKRRSFFSPLPPLLFPLYLVPCFLSRESLIFGQPGISFLRILESAATALGFMWLSFMLAFIGPNWLADYVTPPKESKPSAGKPGTHAVDESILWPIHAIRTDDQTCSIFAENASELAIQVNTWNSSENEGWTLTDANGRQLHGKIESGVLVHLDLAEPNFSENRGTPE